MLKDIKQVTEDLKNYFKTNQKKFWDRHRIKTLIFQTLSKTKLIWLFTILLLILIIKPEDKVLTNKFDYFFTIYGPQFLLFLLFAFMVITISIVFFIKLTDEYNNYLTQSYKSFVKLMKFVTSFIVALILTLVAYTQFHYINTYLVPPLESCTYFDQYGNELYVSEEIGTCPDLTNLELIYEDKTIINIKFGILTNTYQLGKYITYEYAYEGKNIVKRTETTYHLSDADYLNFNLEILKNLSPKGTNTITNIYNENEFISTNKSDVINKDSLLISKLNENNEIVVTYDNNVNDKISPQELYRFTKDGEKISLPNYYLVDTNGFDSNTIIESFNAPLLNDTVINLKKNQYNNYFIEDELIPILTSLELQDYIYYQLQPVSYDHDVKNIDQRSNNTLIYRHVIENAEYGFRVMHYSYRRDKDNQFIDVNTLPQSDLCYANKYLYAVYDYNYNELMSESSTTKCSEDLFYTDNPIFLNYQIKETK